MHFTFSTKCFKNSTKCGSFMQPEGLAPPLQPGGPLRIPWSRKCTRGKMKKGGILFPVADTAQAGHQCPTFSRGNRSHLFISPTSHNSVRCLDGGHPCLIHIQMSDGRILCLHYRLQIVKESHDVTFIECRQPCQACGLRLPY